MFSWLSITSLEILTKEFEVEEVEGLKHVDK